MHQGPGIALDELAGEVGMDADAAFMQLQDLGRQLQELGPRPPLSKVTRQLYGKTLFQRVPSFLGAAQELHNLRYARGSQMARNAAKGFVGRPLENRDSGVVATVSGNTLSKMLSKSSVDKSIAPQAHMQAVANLDTLFKHAVERLQRQDRTGGEGIKSMRHFDVPMPFDGEMLRVKMLVKELAKEEQGNRIYTVQAVEIGKPGSLIGGADLDAADSAQSSPVSDQLPGFEKKFTTLLDAVKAWRDDGTVFHRPASSILGATTKLGDGYLVQVFRGANMSTILHETAHVFMMEMEAVVAAGAADAQLWECLFRSSKCPV